MGAQNTTTIDFGTGKHDVTIQVSAAGIQAGNLVEAWVFPIPTASNTDTNHIVENLKVIAHTVQDGVGFSITALCTQGMAHGVYTIGYVYN